jgi:CHASE1-domain containing sensor protein
MQNLIDLITRPHQLSTIDILLMSLLFTLAFWVAVKAIKTAKRRALKNKIDKGLSLTATYVNQKHPGLSNRGKKRKARHLLKTKKHLF